MEPRLNVQSFYLSTMHRLHRPGKYDRLGARKDVGFMNTYVTSATIKQLREARNLTQAELAERIGVSSKTISKWETAKGLPDVSLLQPLAQALGISLIELMNGEHITNKNTSGNMLRCKFYICPVCGNIIHSPGDPVISC